MFCLFLGVWFNPLFIFLQTLLKEHGVSFTHLPPLKPYKDVMSPSQLGITWETRGQTKREELPLDKQ